MGRIIFLDVDGVLNNRFTETKTKAGWVNWSKLNKEQNVQKEALI